MPLDFDEDKFYLGKLCTRNHEWGDTGLTLRKKKDYACPRCVCLRSNQWAKRNKKANARYSREYYERNKYDVLYRKKSYVAANKEKIKESSHQYNLRPEVKEAKSRYNKAYKERKRLKLARQNKLWRIKNADVLKIRRQEYVKKNKDRILRSRAKYREENRDLIRQQHRESYRRNKDKRKAFANLRRAKKKQVHNLLVQEKDLDQRKSLFDNKCVYCGNQNGPFHWDHFLPLCLGGSHVLGNLVLTCASCNLTKNKKDPYEWYSAQDFFSVRKWNKLLKLLGKTPANYNQLPLL